MPGPSSAHLHDGEVALDPDLDADARAVGRVAPDVREEVVEQLSQPNVVAHHGHRTFGHERDPAMMIEVASRLNGLGH
ncbi:MAG TPA: hypothetical protein VMT79_08245, partial [Candidatus Binatia bacterium]|nr:hypothetical protein [Candidatus Binatia bacterium]